MDTFLPAGPGLSPLAVLTDEAAADLGRALGRFDERLQRPDVPGNLAKELSGAGFILSGLRYDEAPIRALCQRLNMTLEDSTTYQLILRRGRAVGEAEGETREARRLLVRLGTKRFGPPPASAQSALDAVTDRERLERMFDAALTVAGWDELLATP